MRLYLGQIQSSAIPPIRLNKTKTDGLKPSALTATLSGDALRVRVGALLQVLDRTGNVTRSAKCRWALMMPTSRRAAALVTLAVFSAGACSLPGSTAKPPSPAASASRTSSPSSSTSQSPSPAPVTGAFGVLVSSLSGSSYTVSLVGIDGRVIASAIANTPGTVTCANAAGGIVPAPVSTSDTRVYFMDAVGVVRYLSPNGDTGTAVTLPIGPARRSLFAVSPDDSLMAVVVLDFTASGATTKLYMYQLQSGGSQNLLFSQ